MLFLILLSSKILVLKNYKIHTDEVKQRGKQVNCHYTTPNRQTIPYDYRSTGCVILSIRYYHGYNDLTFHPIR